MTGQNCFDVTDVAWYGAIICASLDSEVSHKTLYWKCKYNDNKKKTSTMTRRNITI